MGLFKTRTNKRFSYQPRYYKKDGSPYEIKSKFDDYRKATAHTPGLKNKFNNAMDDYNETPDDYGANKRVVIIVAILVLLFLFVIGFDLSIFFDR